MGQYLKNLKKFQLNIPNNTIFFIKPNIVLRIIKNSCEFLLRYPSIITVVSEMNKTMKENQKIIYGIALIGPKIE